MRPDRNSISYRPMKAGEVAVVVDLVLETFDRFVAPGFSEEGVAEFKRFVNVDALAKRFEAGNIFILAEDGERIVGVVEMRDNSHVALLFVDEACQKNGIARELFGRSSEICVKRDPELNIITVNASPNATAAYENLGFVKTDDEQLVNGIRFVPMVVFLDKNREQPTVSVNRPD